MVVNPIYWTVHDLALMPDDGGWKRYEIIGGELLVTRAPHIRHQGLGGKIYVALERWSQETLLGEPFQFSAWCAGVLDCQLAAEVPGNLSTAGNPTTAVGNFTGRR